MKRSLLIIGFNLMATLFLYGQDAMSAIKQEKEIRSLIDTYSQARTKKDSVLLEHILTKDIDQLVSSGTWRRGKREAFQGMMQSSESNPGSRSITVDHLRFINADCAIVDARYMIENNDGTARKMWSTFIVVRDANQWKISAIRNMLPRASDN